MFPYFSEAFDAQDQKEYTFRFKLRAGESIVSAQLDEVDITSTTVIDPSVLVFGQKSIGIISGTIFGVTQWLLPLAADVEPFVAYLRCKITTDYASPLPHQFTRTMRLSVGQL